MEPLPTTLSGWVMLIVTLVAGVLLRDVLPRLMPKKPDADPANPVPTPSPFPAFPPTIGNGEILAWLAKLTPVLLPIFLPLLLEKIKDGTLKIEAVAPPEDPRP